MSQQRRGKRVYSRRDLLRRAPLAVVGGLVLGLALGKPMVCGPHMDNFRSAVEALIAADAVRILRSPDALAHVIPEVLRDRAVASVRVARPSPSGATYRLRCMPWQSCS